MVLSQWMEVPAELRVSHIRVVIHNLRARGPLKVKLVPLEPMVASLVLAERLVLLEQAA